MEKKTLKNKTTDLVFDSGILSGKQLLLLIPLTKFYSENGNITKLKDILDGKSKLSLRLVDWFVTNYSKKNLTYYNLEEYKLKYNQIQTRIYIYLFFIIRTSVLLLDQYTCILRCSFFILNFNLLIQIPHQYQAYLVDYSHIGRISSVKLHLIHIINKVGKSHE